MKDILKTLTSIDGVSGNEGKVREGIKSYIHDKVDSIKEDSMGNLIVYKKGKRSKFKVMLCAHMDEVGLIVSSITEDGFLKFRNVGGIDPRILVAKRVRIKNSNVFGVLGIKAIHLQEKRERKQAVKIKNMYIDIGANNKKEAEKIVSLGDYVAFDSGFCELGEQRIMSKALDDRAGCSILIKLLENTYDFDIYACFTVQEETGLRGAKVASYQIQPDAAIVLEGTTASDVAGVKEHMYSSVLDNGPVLTLMDRTSVGNREMIDFATETAEKLNIPYQFKKSITGGNDAGSIYVSRSGVKTISISIPCRYIHSPYSMMSEKDFVNAYSLVDGMLKGWKV